MILLLVIFVLAFCYAAFTGFSMVNYLVGITLSIAALWFLPQLPRARAFNFPPLDSGTKVFRFVVNTLMFIFDFLVDLTLSNFLIAADVWTFTQDKYRPLIVYVPVHDLTDFELTLLSSRITLTPGTLSADVTADRGFLIVHVMYTTGTKEEMIESLRRPIDLLRRNMDDA